MVDAAYGRAGGAAASFADALATALDGRLIGFYLIGSYALGDLQPESDLDFLAVLDGPPAPVADRIRSVHAAAAPGEHALEGFYAAADDLRRHPGSALDPRLHFLDGELRTTDGALVVEWEMLRRHGHRITGPPVADLAVFDASADLARFSHDNLQKYWIPWIERTGPYLIQCGREQAAWAAAWCVLGVPRLHVAIADGEIVSKTEAGRRARAREVARWRPVIDAALDHRRCPDQQSTDTLAALADPALAFAAHALEAALALPIS